MPASYVRYSLRSRQNAVTVKLGVQIANAIVVLAGIRAGACCAKDATVAPLAWMRFTSIFFCVADQPRMRCILCRCGRRVTPD